MADEAPVGGLAPGAEEGPERRRWAGLGPAPRGCPRAPASCGVCPAVCVTRGLGAVRRRGEVAGPPAADADWNRDRRGAACRTASRPKGPR